MNAKDFLNKSNISMIWDVISDEDIFKFLERGSQNSIAQLFKSNIQGFYESEISKTNNLVDMNKKYILLILNHIKKNHQNHQIQKIKIYDDPPSKENITYEEIQNEKRSQFEKDLYRRQEEFTSAITVPVPPKPDFADKVVDKPIGEMEKAIKEMALQRSYEIAEINKNLQNNRSSDFELDEWIRSKETSTKSEKLPVNGNLLENKEQQKKNVTWGNNSEYEMEQNIYTNNYDKSINNKNEGDSSEDAMLFKKLKRIEVPLSKVNNIPFEINKNLNNADLNNADLNNYDLNYNNHVIDDRLDSLEKDVKELNNKIDIIIQLLKK
jgi:hypothetical protein